MKSTLEKICTWSGVKRSVESGFLKEPQNTDGILLPEKLKPII